MKEQGKASDNSEEGTDNSSDGDTAASSLGEKCDTLMMPWITCIQSHRNTYTLISNKFFQDEYVDAVEKGIRDEDKVCLGGGGSDNNDNGDGSSPTPPLDWKQFVEFSNYDWLKDGEEVTDQENETVVRNDGEESPDANLVEGVARINLWDGDGKGKNGRRRVDLAYVRDQDGLLLGHERFEIKKTESGDDNTQKEGSISNGETDSTDGENIGTRDDKSGSEPSIGHCGFHVSPGTTKAIQIFALYGKEDDDNTADGGIKEEKIEDDMMEDAASATDSKDIIEKRGKQTLYYSGLIPLSELKPLPKKSLADD